MSQRSSVVSPRPDESAANMKASQPDMSVGSQPLNKSQQQVVAGQKSGQSILKEGSVSQIGGGSQSGLNLPGRDNVDEDFRPVLLKVWQNLSINYKTQMNRALKNVRLHRE